MHHWLSTGNEEKGISVLPKTREQVQDAISFMTIETYKSSERFLRVNDQQTGIVVFTCDSKLDCLCNIIQDIFVDGTFKCCAKFFHQMYTIHGCKNVNYIPLLYALLPEKSEECYRHMWNLILGLCSTRQFVLNPVSIHIDFEQAMHNVFLDVFPTSRIDCCRFHLGQSWWPKIQKLELSTEYKEKTEPIGVWLSQFFGLPFLPLVEVGDCFAEDIMSEAPEDKRCTEFSDYVLETYIAPEARYPPVFWAAAPIENCKRINNGPESFHAHFNEQFYSNHPNIYIYLDVLKMVQSATYIKIRALDKPAAVRRYDKEQPYVIGNYQTYVRGDIIRTIACKYSARTDL